jgi:flavin reductase (DIM6/NTAB) family NADH-FMN oxidoreductase RutF
MTCTSLTSVTVAPPVLLTCLNVRSGTLEAALSSGGFAVNLLHSRAQYAAEVFSSPAPDRFARTAWQPSKVLNAPWLSGDAFAVAECVIEETMPTGDHVVVFGRVVNIDQSTDVPLLYGLRQFSAWMSDSVTHL